MSCARWASSWYFRISYITCMYSLYCLSSFYFLGKSRLSASVSINLMFSPQSESRERKVGLRQSFFLSLGACDCLSLSKCFKRRLSSGSASWHFSAIAMISYLTLCVSSFINNSNTAKSRTNVKNTPWLVSIYQSSSIFKMRGIINHNQLLSSFM